MKNNEYFGNIATGYTLFGNMMSPSITFNPNKFLRLQTGVFIRRDFGNDKFESIIPTMTMKAQKNGFAVVVGTLEGNVSHHMIQPLFHAERYMSKHVENGGQFLVNKKRFQSDMWIDWEKMIYPGSQFNEIITAGLSMNSIVFNKKHFKIALPMQGIIHHYGGQINSNPFDHIISIWNRAVGLSLRYENLKGIFSEIKSENFYVHDRDISPFKQTVVHIGDGYYFNFSFKTKFHFSALASYWNGLNYYSPLGNPLFQSQSSFDVTFFEPNRHLLLFSFQYEEEILPNFFVDVRYEPYFDLLNKLHEYSYSAYFIYRSEFKIFKLKN